jgi:ubiquinone/menaquinone biosynthesis C-methylase UbiE
MTEMSPVARFFVNTFTGRVNRRRYQWLAENVHLPARPTALEVGCGNGDLAARVVDGMDPARYVATDLDPDQIAAASRHLARRYPRGIPAPLELQEANMLELPFPANCFDLVLAYTVLHHASATHRDFSQVPRALVEIDRVLRPGGNLVYEEFLHKEKIRAWLSEHGYAIAAVGHRWSRETVAAVKSAPNQGAVNGKV